MDTGVLRPKLNGWLDKLSYNKDFYNGPRYATEGYSEERSRHMQDYHKFGECDKVKKFFRADHFR
ncbi:unnamed protein product [Clonostachys chloroleuca]|uniref:Uncharacterized protein n=1 Tax=Clonostachys chloroleuca TaxID=1926264 RepID=A0AA35QCF4_9HYPO|nr:unnamed protein product [Clonostachys chloroleuca]